jgi:hypothetical protein
MWSHKRGNIVMAGHSRPKDGVASLAYVPAIHAFPSCHNKDVDARPRFTLGPAGGRTRVPGMTSVLKLSRQLARCSRGCDLST